MDKCAVRNNSLIINGKVVNFQYEIDNVKECGNLLIVLVDIPSNVQAVNNVYAVNENGQIVWQIEDAGSVYSIQNDVPYVGTRITETSQLVVTNFNGVTFTVEPVSGKIIGKGCTK